MLLTTDYLPLATHYSLLTTHYSPLTVHYLLLATYYLLLAPTQLRRYDFSPPAGTHLILSVPGRYSLEKVVDDAARGFVRPDGERPVVEAELYGQLALKRHLEAALKGRGEAERPTRVEFALSSMGQLKDILEPLLGQHCSELGASGLRKPDKHASRAFLTGTASTTGQPAKAYVIWPTLMETLPAFAKGKGLLTIGGGKNTMTGPSDAMCEQLKSCMAHNTMTNPARRRTLHHIKMAAGIIVHGSAPGHSGTNSEPKPPLCAWIYAGSHNLSGSAWGKVEEAEDANVAADQRELVCMAYEVGVLLVPPKPLQVPLPWLSPAQIYDPTKVRPFATNRFLVLRLESNRRHTRVALCPRPR